jgi:hypothetical protein
MYEASITLILKPQKRCNIKRPTYVMNMDTNIHKKVTEYNNATKITQCDLNTTMHQKSHTVAKAVSL